MRKRLKNLEDKLLVLVKEAHQDLLRRLKTTSGKSKKIALIALCNKLLKQAFAITKSGLIYDGNYKSTLM